MVLMVFRNRFAKIIPVGLVGFALTGPLCQATFSFAVAEAKGISINQDTEKNITVTIDPSLIPNAQIKRKDGTMVIDLPDSSFPADFEKTRLHIDSALKNKANVEVGRTAKGTAITIHSNSVFLNIEETDQQKAEDSEPPPTPKATPKASSAQEKALATPPVPVPKETTGNGAKREKPKIEALGGLPLEELKKSEELTNKALSAVEQSIVSVANKSKKTDDKGKAQDGGHVAFATSLLPTDETGNKPKETPAEPPLPQTVSGQADTTDWMTEGKTGRPLQSFARQREQAMDTKGTILRIMGNLAIVLLLLAAFLKYALPKLIERFPGLLQRGESTNGGNAFAPARPPEPASKRQFLERVNHNQETFNVVTTTPLGGGKELHLVEIKGRQLVIATTAHTVNLITEIRDEDEPEFDAESFMEELPVRRAPSSTAYLEENTSPATMAARQPAPTSIARGDDDDLDPPFQDLYKKYTTKKYGSGPAFNTGTSSRVKPPAQHRPLPEPPPVDAEEVVILEDYEDEY